jgi:hypothetical protein
MTGPPLLRFACSPCSTYCPSTPPLVKRRAPPTDRPLMHFASPPGEKCGLEIISLRRASFCGAAFGEPVRCAAGRKSRSVPHTGQVKRQRLRQGAHIRGCEWRVPAHTSRPRPRLEIGRKATRNPRIPRPPRGDVNPNLPSTEPSFARATPYRPETQCSASSI